MKGFKKLLIFVLIAAVTLLVAIFLFGKKNQDETDENTDPSEFDA